MILLFSFAAAVFAAEPAAPKLPNEIKMTSGTVLRNISVVRWASDHVVLKHANGVDPIRFAYIAEPYRSQVIAFRDAAKSAPPATATAAGRESVIKGQVFITTRGAGSYKFGSTEVIAYPLADYENIQRNYRAMRPSIPNDTGHITTMQKLVAALTPVSRATTDADGLFSLKVPAGQPVFLYAVSTRRLTYSTEYNLWTVPADSTADRVDLNTDNCITISVPN